MGKMTVLEMTQNILSAMDSDVVDSTEDTEEAKQVKTIIIETYNELMSRKEWNHLKLPVHLQALDISIAEDHPTTLLIPENVTSIEQVRYDNREADLDAVRWSVLRYVEPSCFLDNVLSRPSSDTNVETVEVVGSTATIMVYNNQQPTFWTSFDDQHITFDSYNAALGNTVEPSRTIIYATVLPVFPDDDDDYVPEMPARMFPMFLAECKKAAFLYLKEMQSPIDEKRSFRGTSIFSNGGARAHERTGRPRFGRR